MTQIDPLTKVNPSKTHALLIGIEHETNSFLHGLDGPANDIYRFADWLRQRKVPECNISILLSPLKKNEETAQKIAGLVGKESLSPATKAEVDQAFKQFKSEQFKKNPASLFVLFWSGHGAVTPSYDRLLFYADTTESCENLNFTAQLTAMRSTFYEGLPEQIFIVDACANVFESDTVKQLPCDQLAIGAELPKHRQLVMFAASPGEYARNEKGGLFSDHILRELNLLPVEAWPPDMETVMSRVQRRFIDLREEGKAAQTPFFLTYRPFSGGEQNFGQIQPAPQITENRKSLKLSGRKLDLPDQLKLKSLIMECFCMKKPEIRTAVIEQLRPEILNNLRRSNISNVEVSNLLDISLEYQGGFVELLTLIKNFESNNPRTLGPLWEKARQLFPEEIPKEAWEVN